MTQDPHKIILKNGVKMKECRMGYYFARECGTDNITIVGCWGEKIEKETKSDVEVLEQVPPKVIEHSNKGIKILNLQNIIRGRIK